MIMFDENCYENIFLSLKQKDNIEIDCLMVDVINFKLLGKVIY